MKVPVRLATTTRVKVVPVDIGSHEHYVYLYLYKDLLLGRVACRFFCLHFFLLQELVRVRTYFPVPSPPFCSLKKKSSTSISKHQVKKKLERNATVLVISLFVYLF